MMRLRGHGHQLSDEDFLALFYNELTVSNFKGKIKTESGALGYYQLSGILPTRATPPPYCQKHPDIVMKIVNEKKLSHQVFNSDQSGFNYEMCSNRTLSNVGEKLTLATISSHHAFTHSYTVQPTISMDGKLHSPLFICLQEFDNKFGFIVERNLLHPRNIHLSCSKSGKLSKFHFKDWCENVLYPNVDGKCLLLLDSWSGHKDNTSFNHVFKDKKTCERLEIPPRTTSFLQSLDVYFFRQYKIFARKIYTKIHLYGLDINMNDRNNIIRMHSLIHHQLTSAKFNKMIKYSWFKAGYLNEDPGKFLNVNQVCFSHLNTTCTDNCSQYTDGVFIRCSHCEKYLCFKHFFIDFHCCN